MKRVFAAAVALLALTASAQARDPYPPMIDGKKLLELCNGRDQTKRFSCGYYVMGAIDSQINYETLPGSGAKPALCPPPGKTPEEFVTVVKHYLENHLDERDRPAYALTWTAMRAAFPCP